MMRLTLIFLATVASVCASDVIRQNRFYTDNTCSTPPILVRTAQMAPGSCTPQACSVVSPLNAPTIYTTAECVDTPTVPGTLNKDGPGRWLAFIQTGNMEACLASGTIQNTAFVIENQCVNAYGGSMMATDEGVTAWDETGCFATDSQFIPNDGQCHSVSLGGNVGAAKIFYVTSDAMTLGVTALPVLVLGALMMMMTFI